MRGCQPKKYLVANAEAVATARRLTGKGIKAAPQTDWPSLPALKNEFLNGKSVKALESWQEKGVATFREHAWLSGPNEVTLASGIKLTAEHIVLATGSKPRELDIPGSRHVKNSDDFLELDERPDRICFIGGLIFAAIRVALAGWPSSKRIGETHGTFKVLIDNKTGLLLGGHLARHNAAEVINIFALAMANDIPANKLADFIWAYPTYVSDVKYMVG